MNPVLHVQWILTESDPIIKDDLINSYVAISVNLFFLLHFEEADICFSVCLLFISLHLHPTLSGWGATQDNLNFPSTKVKWF